MCIRDRQKIDGYYTTYLDTGSQYSHYPFHIAVRGEHAANVWQQSAVGTLVFRRADGTNTIEISSSMPITSSASTPEWRHIVCQKSASVLQIYVDGKLNEEINDNQIDGHIINNSPLFFGAGMASGSVSVDGYKGPYEFGQHGTQNAVAHGHAYQGLSLIHI